MQEKATPNGVADQMPRRGLEPPLSYNENHHLKVARLPIPPPGPVDVRGSIHRVFDLSSPLQMIAHRDDVGLSELGGAGDRGLVYHPKKVDSGAMGTDSSALQGHIRIRVVNGLEQA